MALEKAEPTPYCGYFWVTPDYQKSWWFFRSILKVESWYHDWGTALIRAQKWPEANVNSVLSSHNCTTHFSHHFLGTTTMNGNFSISTSWGVFSQIMASLTSLIIVEHYAHKSYHILDFDSYKDYKWWWSFYNRENFGVERAASTSNCRAVRNIKSLLYEEDHGTELFSAITWIL